MKLLKWEQKGLYHFESGGMSVQGTNAYKYRYIEPRIYDYIWLAGKVDDCSFTMSPIQYIARTRSDNRFFYLNPDLVERYIKLGRWKEISLKEAGNGSLYQCDLCGKVTMWGPEWIDLEFVPQHSKCSNH